MLPPPPPCHLHRQCHRSLRLLPPLLTRNTFCSWPERQAIDELELRWTQALFFVILGLTFLAMILHLAVGGWGPEQMRVRA